MQQNQVKPYQKQLKDVIQPFFIVGYRKDFKNNLFYSQHQIQQQQIRDVIVYPAANSIVMLDNAEKKQIILPALLGSKGISCLTVSPNKRYIAWAEEFETGIIVIYDTKNQKTKTLQTLDCKSRSYVSLDFWPYQDPNEAKDGKDKNIKEDKSKRGAGKYLVALSAPPEQMLIHWNWDKQKCLGSTVINAKGDNFKYYNAFFHPKEDDFVCVVGNGAIKLYKLIPDNQPKQKDSPFQKKKDIKETQHSSNYLSYCILSDGKTMVVGTDNGEILYFTENCEFKLILPTSPSSDVQGYAIESIIKYSNGFIIGGSESTIYIYKKHEGDLKNPYIRVDKKIQIKPHPTKKHRIISLLLNQAEDTLILGLDSGQIYQIPFSAEREADDTQLKYDPLLMSFHSEAISGIDVCIRKQLIATTSKDRSVRIWNYNDPNLEMFKEFEDQPVGIAFHPSGLHLIASFSDKINLYNIFERDLISFKEIHIKNVDSIKFCNGGHLFAILNNNIVQIYQFYTGENPQNYSFKHQSGKILSLEWDGDDLGFFTGGSDGYLYYWKLEDNQNKTQVFFQQNYGIDTIAVAHSDQYIYFASQQDQTGFFEVQLTNKAPKGQESIGDIQKKLYALEPKRIMTNSTISRMILSKSEKLFFFATNSDQQPGSVRVVLYPFSKDPNDIFEIALHNSGITQMKITFDDNFLFTVSSDGSIIIYKIVVDQFKIKLDKDGVGSQFAEEFLLQREKYKKKIGKLEAQRQLIKTHELESKNLRNQYQREKDDNLAKLEKEKQLLLKTEQDKYNLLLQKHKQLQKDFEDNKLNLHNQHEENKKRTEAECKQKLILEQQRYEELCKDRENQLKLYQKHVEDRKTQQEQQKKAIYADYEKRLNEEKELYKQLQEDKDRIKREFDNKREQLEDEAEREIDVMKESNEAQMKILFEEYEKAEMEKQNKRQEHEKAQQDLETEFSRKKQILEEIQQNKQTNEQYQKEKDSHAKEIEERDKTIRDKGKRIYELKKKTQELEKFKFVLDYKIKELKREQGPREDEITKMKEQIANMQSEILHFKRVNANLSLIVTDLHLRQSGMKREIDSQSDVLEQNNKYIKAFEYDISDAHTTLNDFKKLKESMLKLFNNYVQSDQQKKKSDNQELQNQFIKERAHLETTNKGLKEKFSKKLRVHKQDNNRIMNQNVDLISEINDLKREIKMLQDEEKLKELNLSKPEEKTESQLDIEIERNEKDINDMKEQVDKLRREVELRSQQQHMLSDSDN